MIVIWFELVSFEVDIEFLVDSKALRSRIWGASYFLRESWKNKVKRRWSLQIKQLFEFSTFSDGESQIMIHIFERLSAISYLFFSYFVLDIIEQLKFI